MGRQGKTTDDSIETDPKTSTDWGLCVLEQCTLLSQYLPLQGCIMGTGGRI